MCSCLTDCLPVNDDLITLHAEWPLIFPAYFTWRVRVHCVFRPKPKTTGEETNMLVSEKETNALYNPHLYSSSLIWANSNGPSILSLTVTILWRQSNLWIVIWTFPSLFEFLITIGFRRISIGSTDSCETAWRFSHWGVKIDEF